MHWFFATHDKVVGISPNCNFSNFWHLYTMLGVLCLPDLARKLEPTGPLAIEMVAARVSIFGCELGLGHSASLYRIIVLYEQGILCCLVIQLITLLFRD